MKITCQRVTILDPSGLRKVYSDLLFVKHRSRGRNAACLRVTGFVLILFLPHLLPAAAEGGWLVVIVRVLSHNPEPRPF